MPLLVGVKLRGAGMMQPVSSLSYGKPHRALAFSASCNMCARAAQRIEQAAFASAPGPSRFESAHYSGHHNAVRLCMAGSPWYLRQDDGTEDADSTVAELCALLEQARITCTASPARTGPFKGLSLTGLQAPNVSFEQYSSCTWFVGMQHGCRPRYIQICIGC